MANEYTPYAKIYVNQKSKLMKLIEKYSGESTKKMKHGELANLYIYLLRNNEDFRTEVDALILRSGYSNAAGLLAGIISGATSIFSSVTASKAEQEKQDTLLYEAVLNSQSNSDTTKILIVSGVAVVFVIIGVILVRRKK
jgi:hypothetical protein